MVVTQRRHTPGGPRIDVPHAHVHHGDRCPHCAKGKLYAQREPGLLIRFVGQAPIAATVYALEKLRCNVCGDLFSADPPAGVGAEKYDVTAGAMIAVLRYGTGLPFHRLERLQANLQIPRPASTQWEIVSDLAMRLQPVLHTLTEQAAQGKILHNDDTSMTGLELTFARRSPTLRPSLTTKSTLSARNAPCASWRMPESRPKLSSS